MSAPPSPRLRSPAWKRAQATVSAPALQRAVQLGFAGRLEGAAAFAACLAAAVFANGRLLRPDVVSDDALVHQFWMRHWQDPALFNDPLTSQLRESVRYPDGYQALFWSATHVVRPDRVRRVARGRR